MEITKSTVAETNEVKSTLNTLIKILKLTPAQRNSRHLQTLEKAFEEIRFFKEKVKEFGMSLFENVCEKVHYEYIEAGNNVFEHGSHGTKFYIIIQGLVSVHVPIKNDGTDEFKKVSELSSGMAFGELALIKDQPRAATIKAITDCHLAVLNKEDYLRVIGKAEHHKLEQTILFLRKIPLFSNLPRKKLERLTYFLIKKNYHRKQVVFKANDLAKFVFIVKSGEFELMKSVKSERTGMNISAKIAILSTGEVIGEREVWDNQRFIASCECLLNGEMFLIQAEHFLFIMDKDSEDLIDQRKMKYNIRDQRLGHFEKIFHNFFDNGKKEESQSTQVVKNVLYKRKNIHIEKKSIRIRPRSRMEIEAIKRRALVERYSKEVESPVSIYSNDSIFTSFSPCSKSEKYSNEMVCHTPGGYYRGKLKRPRTKSNATELIL